MSSLTPLKRCPSRSGWGWSKPSMHDAFGIFLPYLHLQLPSTNRKSCCVVVWKTYLTQCIWWMVDFQTAYLHTQRLQLPFRRSDGDGSSYFSAGPPLCNAGRSWGDAQAGPEAAAAQHATGARPGHPCGGGRGRTAEPDTSSPSFGAFTPAGSQHVPQQRWHFTRREAPRGRLQWVWVLTSEKPRWLARLEGGFLDS